MIRRNKEQFNDFPLSLQFHLVFDLFAMHFAFRFKHHKKSLFEFKFEKVRLSHSVAVKNQKNRK